MTDLTHYKPLSHLQAWDANYNHNDLSILAHSIRRFGFNGAPRVWRSNTVIAGNHITQSLKLIKSEGARPDLDRQYPPENVLVDGDEWYVQWVDVSHLSDLDAKAFAIADNELAKQAVADDDLLAAYLQEIAADDPSSFEATGYDDERLEALLAGLLDDSDESDTDDLDEEDERPKSDGSLLALTTVTIAEPAYQVERGEVWLLDQHVLVCADVLTGWREWSQFLDGDNTVFAPYPGPFVPLVEHADDLRLVMVQPDTYVAGHILDQYSAIKGSDHVHRQD